MADYEKVVQMLGENLASFLEISKKFLLDWEVKPKQLLHTLQNIKKVDLVGLIEGTHEIKPKIIVSKVSLDKKTSFSIWKTIKLGTFKNTGEIINFFKEKYYEFEIDSSSEVMISSFLFRIAWSQKEIQLVKVSVFELCGKNKATYKEICVNAKKLGLKLCPREVGPQLRFQYMNQSEDKSLYIAMNAFSCDGYELIFKLLKRKHKLVLEQASGHPDISYENEYFVFCI